MDEVLVVGQDSKIGRKLIQLYSRKKFVRLWKTTRRIEEIEERTIFLDFSREFNEKEWNCNPRIAIFCAGVTDMAICETDSMTWTINAYRIMDLMKVLIKSKVKIIFLSSNRVFDGEKEKAKVDDPPNPTTEYGRQKLAVERYLMENSDNFVIIRLTKVIGSETQPFKNWIVDLKAERSITPFNDFRAAPLSLDFLSEAIDAIDEHGGMGVYHLSGKRDYSYVELANFIASELGVNNSFIKPVNSSEKAYRGPPVPRHTTLDTSRFCTETGIMIPDIKESFSGVIRA